MNSFEIRAIVKKTTHVLVQQPTRYLKWLALKLLEKRICLVINLVSRGLKFLTESQSIFASA